MKKTIAILSLHKTCPAYRGSVAENVTMTPDGE